MRVAGPAKLFKLFLITGRGRVGEMDVQADSGTAHVTVNSLAGDEWARARFLFDPDQVSGLPAGTEPRYDEWLRETSVETQSYRDNVRATLRESGGASRAPRTPFPTFLAPILWLVAGTFSWWAFRTWRAHGVEPEVAGVGEYFREPPEAIPPGAVPFLMDQVSPGLAVAPQAFGATLLDLARRGFLKLDEREKQGFLGFGGGREVDFLLATPPPAGELTPFEEDVWRLLREARGDDDRVKPDELVKFFRKRTTWMQNWVENPRSWYEREKEPLLVGHHGGRMFLLIGGGIVLMSGLIFVGAFSNNTIVFMSGILSGVTAGLFGVICGAGIPKWRPGPLVRARQWRAYRKFLDDFSAMKEAPAEHYKLWDHHFVYATALGVSKSYLANLKKLMAQEPDRFVTPAWIMAGHDPGRLGSLTRNLESIESNLAGLEANLGALESALSSSTNSGGGFSGGGAGGASGGGSSGAS
ncbi:MAG: membrane protein [bacterium]|nr:MAG: membrane protein [bacterium]